MFFKLNYVLVTAVEYFTGFFELRKTFLLSKFDIFETRSSLISTRYRVFCAQIFMVKYTSSLLWRHGRLDNNQLFTLDKFCRIVFWVLHFESTIKYGSKFCAINLWATVNYWIHSSLAINDKTRFLSRSYIDKYREVESRPKHIPKLDK